MESHMADQRWLDEIRKGLARAGIPASYVSRVVAELADHADDLTAEGTDVLSPDARSARLGEVPRLIECTISNYQSQRTAGRRPLLFFFVLPPLVALILA